MDEIWSPDFQRLILATALRGDLLRVVPFDPMLFGMGTDRSPKTPRQRIAADIAAFYANYGTRPPIEVFSQLAKETADTISPEERTLLQSEIDAVLQTTVPADIMYVKDKIIEQMEFRALEQGLLQLDEFLTQGPSALKKAREVLTRAMQPIEERKTSRVRILADAEARLALWRAGDQMGERISTGFPELDRALRGGPTRKEVHYFLAPPKGAKTAALMTVATAAARQKLGVYVATFEMQAMRMALRADRQLSKNSAEELTESTINLERALQGLRMVGAGEIYIDELPPQMPGSVAEVRRRISEIRRGGGRIDVAVLDYLNIMGSGREEDEKRHELPRISREMSAMAKEDDVLLWSAALVNRKAVNKKVVTKIDIAEAFEVVAVADGMTAICATKDMINQGIRRFRQVAAREEADEMDAGDYKVDFARQQMYLASDEEVAALRALEALKDSDTE